MTEAPSSWCPWWWAFSALLTRTLSAATVVPSTMPLTFTREPTHTFANNASVTCLLKYVVVGPTLTVNVSPTTTFVGHHDGSDGASFADVCVGNKVGAKGDVTDTTVASATVIVTGDHMGDHQGDHEGDGHDSDAQEHEIEHHDSVTSSDDSGSGGQHDGSSNDAHDDGSGDQVSGHE